MQSSRVVCFGFVVASVGATIQCAFGDDARGPTGTTRSPAAILERALLAAGEASDDPSLRGQIAIAFARAGQVGKASELAARIPEQSHREWILCNIAAVLDGAGEHERAVRTAGMLHDNRRCQAAAWLAILEARAGDVDCGLKTIDAILEPGPDSQMARRWLAWELESVGNLPVAIRIFESTGDPLDRARAFNAAARDRLRTGDFAGARRAADETSRVIRDIQLPKRRSASSMMSENMYRENLFMEIAEKKAATRDWNGADTLIDFILTPHWRVRTIARIAAMRARAGQPDKAKAMFARAFSEAREGRGQGYMFLEIAEAQTAAGDRDAARKTFLRAIHKIRDHVASNRPMPSRDKPRRETWTGRSSRSG